MSDARVIAAIGLCAVVVKVSASIACAHAEVVIAKEVGERLRLELLTGFLRLHRLRSVGHQDQGGVSLTQVDALPSSAIAHATLHVEDVEGGAVRGVIGRARAVLELVPLLALLIWQNGKLAAAAAVVLLPFVLASGVARRHVKREISRASEDVDALAHASDEAVRHADLWVVFGAQSRVRKSIETLGRVLRARAARVAALTSATSGANEVLAAVALVLVACAAKARFFGLEEGALLSFMVVFFLAYKPLRALSDARLALVRADSALSRMDPLLASDSRGESHDVDDVAPREWKRGTLACENLRVRGVAAPISFTLARGEILAIVGATGAGKTTLVRTLLGLVRAEGGTLAYAGERIEKAPVGPDARPFAYVPQDAPLVFDSLAGNIAIGGENADARAILDSRFAGALKDLGAAPLGVGGRALSGGERQIVNLARAFASRAPIIVLDEPTSALDVESEKRVLEFLALAKKDRALIVVTHKPAPLAEASRVLTLHADGSVQVESRAPSEAARSSSEKHKNAVLPWS